MDRLDIYRNYIETLVRQYAEIRGLIPTIHRQAVCDRTSDTYGVCSYGWHKNRRIWGFSIHITVRQDKVCIEHNGCDRDIAQELVNMGIPKEDIVLCFLAPGDRTVEGFGELSTEEPVVSVPA